MPDPSASAVSYAASNGYVLTVNNAANGPGSVSVAATSPCFWSRNDAVGGPKLAEAQPHTIK